MTQHTTTGALGGRYLTEEELRPLGFRRVGRRVRIHERASVYGASMISLGDDVRIDDFTVIIATGALDIGSWVSIPNFCFIGAKFGVRIDDFVTLAPGVKIFTASDDYHGDVLTGPVVPAELTGGTKGPVWLQRHVLIGAGTVVLPGCTLAEGASVGALSLVKTDLDPWAMYAGVPARRLADRSRRALDLERRCREGAVNGEG